MESSSMESLVKQLADLRGELERARKIAAEAEEDMRLTDHGQMYLDAVRKLEVLKERTAKVEEEVRWQAVAIYQIVGEKQPALGVSVQLRKKVDYDPLEAKDYCISHQIFTALKLDNTLFERYVRAMDGIMPIPVAKLYEQPTAAIAQNLQELYQ